MSAARQRVVLLVCSTTRDTPRAVETAIAAAASDSAELEVCFVLDPALVEATRERMARSGFEAGGELDPHALVDEYRDRAERFLAAVCVEAEAAGLMCQHRVVEGPFVESALAAMADSEPERVLVSRKRRSQYSRLLHEEAVGRLAESAGVTIEVVDDE